jgi:hypothetical protein
MIPQPHLETMKKEKPQITQIFLFFLRVFSHLPSFSTSYLPSFRVPSCNFVANLLRLLFPERISRDHLRRPGHGFGSVYIAIRIFLKHKSFFYQLLYGFFDFFYI